MTGRITIIGAGVSGRALALWARKLGADVFVSDVKEYLAPEVGLQFQTAGIEWETGCHSEACCDSDLMVISSGVSPASPAVEMARRKGLVVQGELEFLAPWLKGPVVAVTGTNGKTTTTALVGHLLRANGLKTAVVGNIGDPLANAAGRKWDAIVMELSSFQLHWSRNFTPQVALLTNLAPDHIDWHGSYEQYCSDKAKVFGQPTSNNWAIVQRCDVSRVPEGGKICTLLGHDETRIEWDDSSLWLCQKTSKRKLFDRHRLRLVGRHNLENAAMATAAVALCWPELDPSAGLEDFLPPPHRCQLVTQRRGVLWVDDSKGTNVASTRTALQGIAGEKIVILGGKGKGEVYDELAETVKVTAREALLLGAEADAIEAALRQVGYQSFHRVAHMDEAVALADALSRPGDTVLLSPACTSWDMYSSYVDRGKHFASLVKALEE